MHRAVLGFLLGWIAKLWIATLRITLIQHPNSSQEFPWVLTFFHGQQFALLGWKRRKDTAILVSLSRDGDIQSKALPILGMIVCRGSSSRGGARGLASLIRLLRARMDAAFAVDGPRGPWGTVHPGAIAAAHHAQGLLIPMGCASSRSWILKKTWDRFELPYPFSRVVIVLGPAILPDMNAPDLQADQLGIAIQNCIQEARFRIRLTFENSMRIALVNGSSEQGISPWDRGLLYGDGVFETLRTYQGCLFALEDHLRLLEDTATSLGINATSSVLRLRTEVQHALSLAGPGEQLVRLLLSRGEGAGAALQADGEPTRIVLVEPLLSPHPSLFLQGVRVVTAPEITVSGPKTLAYLPRLLALQRARAQGASEVLFLDSLGNLEQGSTCNLLWVCRGKVRAPVSPNGRAGVTRARILARLTSLGWSLDEQPIQRDALQGEAELLLCSTIREVLPIVWVDHTPVGTGLPGEAASILRQALKSTADE